MDLDALMQTTPETLARVQRDALRAHVLQRLKAAGKLFERGDYADLMSLLTLSPAGDECGTDHYFLNFSYDGTAVDLQEIIEQIQGLDAVITQQEQNKRR